jgi:hypothetical protein
MFDFLPADRERAAFRHRLNVACEVVRERDFKLVALQTFDVSVTGMMVETLRDVSIGEEMIVTFRPPQSLRYVDAQAIVSRVIAGNRRGDLGTAVGLLFTEMDHSSFITLRTALRRLPATGSQRRSRIDYAAMARVISML